MVKETEKKLFAGKPGPGRPKGVPNKATASIKEAMLAVYAKLQENKGEAHGHFLAWAEENPTEFYKLASKLLPLQVGGDPDNPLQAAVTVTFRQTDAPSRS